MPVNQDFPTLNGEAQSWANISASLTVQGGTLLETSDFSDITWTRTVEVGEQRGASGGRVMRRTVGQVSYESSITLYASGYERLVAALMESAPSRGNQKLISLVAFDLQIFHTMILDAEEAVREVKIKGCRLLSDSFSGAEGVDADKVEVGISTIEIVKVVNGQEVAMI